MIAVAAPFAVAGKKTICTITVNSPDEKEALRRRLPKDQYRFVELVTKGRSDWLRSSCEEAIECDVLVISGHFNAGDVFYSDKAAANEFLRVDELERASCSNSCPMLFSRLKEVYLFGCESLNPDSSKYASAYGESGRDRMRRLFAGVPSIYGFSGPAPVGATAAMLLNRYFDTGATNEIGTGRTSCACSPPSRETPWCRSRIAPRRCAHVVPRPCAGSTTSARRRAEARRHSRDDEARHGRGARFFERIENFLAFLTDDERHWPLLAGARAGLGRRCDPRTLFARRAASVPRCARMVKVAATLGWLTQDQERDEQVRIASDLIARDAVGYAEVDLLLHEQ